MSEVHIRINKRVVERSIFLVIIVVLAVLLFLRTPAPVVDTAQLDNLQAENAALLAQVATLQDQIDILEKEPEVQEVEQTAPEPETPATNPEPQLSGDIQVNWSIRMNQNSFERATIVLENGRDRSEDVTYVVYWNNFFQDTVNVQASVFLASGATRTIQIPGGDGGLTANPPPATDTLVLRVTDSSGRLVRELRERVR